MARTASSARQLPINQEDHSKEEGGSAEEDDSAQEDQMGKLQCIK